MRTTSAPGSPEFNGVEGNGARRKVGLSDRAANAAQPEYEKRSADAARTVQSHRCKTHFAGPRVSDSRTRSGDITGKPEGQK